MSLNSPDIENAINSFCKGDTVTLNYQLELLGCFRKK